MNFKKDVIDRSQNIPVVVDFWAPWCGPCRFLGPVIEELADRDKGKWELVKVNTDENRDLMTKYQIQGIPAVKMFSKGEVVAEFTGALPRHQIDIWLEEHIPDERKIEFERLVANAKQGEGLAIDKLEKFVEANPDIKGAKSILAQIIVVNDPEKAVQLVDNIRAGMPGFENAENVRILANLFNCELGDNATLAEKLEEARNDLRSGNLDAALNLLVEAVMIDKNYCDELPRKATIALFNILGPDHELTRKYRRRFDMALY